MVRLAPSEARQVASELLRVAESVQDASGTMVGHRAMGACLHLEGRFASAQEHFERALRLYRPEVHQQAAVSRRLLPISDVARRHVRRRHVCFRSIPPLQYVRGSLGVGNRARRC